MFYQFLGIDGVLGCQCDASSYYLALSDGEFSRPRAALTVFVIAITRTMIDNLTAAFDFPFSCFITLSTRR